MQHPNTPAEQTSDQEAPMPSNKLLFAATLAMLVWLAIYLHPEMSR